MVKIKQLLSQVGIRCKCHQVKLKVPSPAKERIKKEKKKGRGEEEDANPRTNVAADQLEPPKLFSAHAFDWFILLKPLTIN